MKLFIKCGDFKQEININLECKIKILVYFINM